MADVTWGSDSVGERGGGADRRGLTTAPVRAGEAWLADLRIHPETPETPETPERQAVVAALYRPALGSIRDVTAAGLLQATSLPFIVAATTIGLQLHALNPANAAALIAAGLFSVIIFPVTALQLLRSPANRPGVVPEHADAG